MKARKTILITGIAGFIGHHLAELLISKGYNVVGIDNLSTGNYDMVTKEADFIKKDIRDLNADFFMSSGYKIDEIYHLAAQARIQKSWDNPDFTYQNNVQGTKQILEIGTALDVKRIMITSSNSVYGEHGYKEHEFKMAEGIEKLPASPYAYHKSLNEEYAKMYSKCWGRDILVVRPFNVYGADQPTDTEYSCVFPKFLEAVRNKEPMPVFGDGTQTRDFTHVDDVVEGMYRLMESDRWKRFEVVNLCTGETTSIRDLAKMFEGPYELVESGRNKEMKWTKGSNQKLYKLTGFRPKRKVKDYVREYRKSQ